MQSYWSQVAKRRVSRRRALAFTGATAAAAALLAACGDDDSDSDEGTLFARPVDTTKQAKRDGTIKDRIVADPPTLDWGVPSTPASAVITPSYSRLVQFAPGYLKPSENEVAPDIAESWEISPDGLQITMKLRQGVKWHNRPPVNGRALDMADMLFSWDRFVSKHSARSTIANAVNPAAPVLSFTSTDDKTIVLKLKEPLVYVLGLFCANSGGSFFVLPKETDTTFDIRRDVIGTGPYELSTYTPSVGFTLKRNPLYWDKDAALAEQIDLALIPEYASAVAQFKAGNIHTFGNQGGSPLAAEDVLPLKREDSRISIYEGDLTNLGSFANRIAFGWLGNDVPFFDERVRQAVSMSWNRELFIDVFSNASNFEAEGLPISTRWQTALTADTATYDSWWLDPNGKDFGPNAKYFKHDVAEAKKLLAAAGYSDGFDVNSNYTLGPELGNLPKQAEVLDGMAREIGIRVSVHGINYQQEYAPKYRDGKGQFEGWTFASDAASPRGGSAVGAIAAGYWSKTGASFAGFSANGKNDQFGDPQVDAMIEKARLERDSKEQRAIVNELQRHLAKTMYSLPMPGIAARLNVAWPCLANYGVYRTWARTNYFLWVDETKPPF